MSGRTIIWPTKPCGRCGGSGKFSWCSMYGDTCFGCSGSGRRFANAPVERAVVAYRDAVKAQKEVRGPEIGPGDVVRVNRDADGVPRIAQRVDPDGEWVGVFDAAADVSDMFTSSWTGARYRTAAERAAVRADVVMASDLGTPRGVSFRRAIVTLETGEVVRVGGQMMYRRRADGVDPVPYMRAAAAALGKTSRAKARAAYEADLAAAGWDLTC